MSALRPRQVRWETRVLSTNCELLIYIYLGKMCDICTLTYTSSSAAVTFHVVAGPNVNTLCLVWSLSLRRCSYYVFIYFFFIECKELTLYLLTECCVRVRVAAPVSR